MHAAILCQYNVQKSISQKIFCMECKKFEKRIAFAFPSEYYKNVKAGGKSLLRREERIGRRGGNRHKER